MRVLGAAGDELVCGSAKCGGRLGERDVVFRDVIVVPVQIGVEERRGGLSSFLSEYHLLAVGVLEVRKVVRRVEGDARQPGEKPVEVPGFGDVQPRLERESVD